MPELTESELRQFIGTTAYHRHWLGAFVLTDGVQYLAEKGEAHWLIDAIASYQPDARVKEDPMLQDFQVWELAVENNSAVLTLLRDTDDPVLTQEIEYTDFPLSHIKLYLTQKVLMLTNEY
ncbi:DUF6876 family protein [Laspinema olomoucense]|uniref:DUF6876 family protein n=1 Tax=Laspinema olomoucense TaxID=3231600 RepID=UPI0021BB3BE7|nr:DUF6876 family protein [Laspinema sp. D3a]MCT7989022.1 hypothetical protein [Laspinema sp. D3a]